ncbi:hypothetical protein DV515_00019722, partial [Chloebia gouldiae]
LLDCHSIPEVALLDCHSIPEVAVTACLVWKDWPHRVHPHGLVGKDCAQGLCRVLLRPQSNPRHRSDGKFPKKPGIPGIFPLFCRFWGDLGHLLGIFGSFWGILGGFGALSGPPPAPEQPPAQVRWKIPEKTRNSRNFPSFLQVLGWFGAFYWAFMGFFGHFGAFWVVLGLCRVLLRPQSNPRHRSDGKFQKNPEFREFSPFSSGFGAVWGIYWAFIGSFWGILGGFGALPGAAAAPEQPPAQ